MRDFAQDIKALTLNTATLGHNLDGHGAGWGVERGTQGVRESLKIVTERLQQALVVAADRGVKLALEPLNPVYAGNRSCLTTLRDALDICDALGSDNLGVAVDVYPMVGHRSFAAVAAGGGGRILGYHLCDWLADTSDVLLDRGMMGDGVADLRAIRANVEAAGYRGACEVEVVSAENWWKRPPDEVLDVMALRFRAVC